MPNAACQLIGNPRTVSLFLSGHGICCVGLEEFVYKCMMSISLESHLSR